jgi:hypothetical protein
MKNLNPPAIVRSAEAPLDALAERINAAHEAAADSISRGLVQAKYSGELLLQARARLPHGAWLPWLRDKTSVNERLAQRYMKIAREWDSLTGKSDTVSHLTFKGALEVLAEKDEPAPPPWPAPMPDFKGGHSYTALLEGPPAEWDCPEWAWAVELVPRAGAAGLWRWAVWLECVSGGGAVVFSHKGGFLSEPGRWLLFSGRWLDGFAGRCPGGWREEGPGYEPMCGAIADGCLRPWQWQP